jgi:alanine racemase
VVKADCYGHGLAALADVIGGEADALAVATPEEAVAVRRHGYDGQVLMFFAPCAFPDAERLAEALDELVARRITLTLVTPEEVAAVAEAARRVGTEAQVHVMIDTGMGREGTPPQRAPDLVGHIRQAPGLKLTGMYTHFATADEADKSFTREQLARFQQAVDACGPREGLTLHAAGSAALIDLRQTHLDMVRPGIAVYGYQPSDQMQTRLPLKPALRLRASLMIVKDAPAGSRCGYGLTHRFDRPSRIGLVPVGYGDGYPRCLSNRAVMRVRGHACGVRGRVSMDQTIVDLTDVPDARVGDEVEVISSDPAAPNSVESLARLAGTIPYEITCGLGKRRIRRVLVD